jgi:hypothetical protein
MSITAARLRELAEKRDAEDARRAKEKEGA